MSKWSASTFGDLETPHSVNIDLNSAKVLAKVGIIKVPHGYQAHTKQRSRSRSGHESHDRDAQT